MTIKVQRTYQINSYQKRIKLVLSMAYRQYIVWCLELNVLPCKQVTHTGWAQWAGWGQYTHEAPKQTHRTSKNGIYFAIIFNKIQKTIWQVDKNSLYYLFIYD